MSDSSSRADDVGTPAQAVVAYLAALAIEQGWELIATDADFARVEGLLAQHAPSR
jgi:predicted nucleic acid-binding protein